jgi:hypothetical protein
MVSPSFKSPRSCALASIRTRLENGSRARPGRMVVPIGANGKVRGRRSPRAFRKFIPEILVRKRRVERARSGSGLPGSWETVLRAGARFTGITFAVRQESEVTLFNPDVALGWTADSLGSPRLPSLVDRTARGRLPPGHRGGPVRPGGLRWPLLDGPQPPCRTPTLARVHEGHRRKFSRENARLSSLEGRRNGPCDDQCLRRRFGSSSRRPLPRDRPSDGVEVPLQSRRCTLG